MTSLSKLIYSPTGDFRTDAKSAVLCTMSNVVDVESELEEEIRIELERLEQIFNEESNIESVTSSNKVKPNRVSYSAYEYAEAEGEKEELEDQLRSFIIKADDYKTKIQHLSTVNQDLHRINEQLQVENARLRSAAAQGHYTDHVSNIGFKSLSVLSPGSIALEHLLAETRAKLFRVEAAYKDLLDVRDASLEELDKERALRIHVGKSVLCVFYCICHHL